jgi:hypothetical protein
MSPAADNVIQRLDAARQKWWLVSLLSTCVLAMSASLGTIMVFMLADSLAKFPQLALAVMLLVWVTLTAVILFGVGRRLLRGQRSIEAAARRVEAEFPELGSDLINLVQLSEDSKNVDRGFCEAAIRQAAQRIGGVAFDRAPDKESRWRRFLYCMQTPRDLVESCGLLILLVATAVVCETLIPNWSSAASRLLAPWKFVPSVGSVEILKVTPGNTDVLVGQSVEIAAEIKNPEGKPHQAALFVTPKGEAESRLDMTADEKHVQYKFTVASVLKPFTYRLEIGDSQTQAYTVSVTEKPVVESAEITFRYPRYLGRKNETLGQKGLDLEAPQYSVAELRLRPSVPLSKGYLESGGERYQGRIDQDGNLMVVSMPLLRNGAYCVRLFNESGHSDPNPRMNRITVIPDRPPSVELLKPARQSSAAPGSNLAVMIRAGDDHGIARLRLEMKIESSESAAKSVDEKKAGDDQTAKSVKEWTDFTGEQTTTAVRHHTLELKPDVVQPGQTILLRATAWDMRAISDWGIELRPQETAGGWHAVKIVAEDAKASAALQHLEGLRAAIWKILEKQIQARAIAGGLPKTVLPSPTGRGAGGEGGAPSSPHPNPLPAGEGTSSSLSAGEGSVSPQRTQVVGNIRMLQIDVQKSSVDLVKSIGSTDREERQAIKRVLNGLAFGEMLQVVTRCDELAKLKSADDFKKQSPELTASQDRIIAVLRKLLDVTRHAQAEVLAEMKKRPGGDLPDDVKQKLEEMHGKLDKFLAQQKKVIEATENLAKVPVEDFTKEQEETLKGMAAAEDDWAKFMKDLHTDLSKLPEQDLANSTMSKELVEVQTELKMAEGELLKKSADIAVPLEQLGAEMAEEIKTNIEKWLYEKPDRLKWSQEEPLTDNFKEAPMAELPGELEDLIGELADQEEDLFDEMEDVTSSWTDSPDKGAGWDAMDGPISTMSAKGVTGNALPNASEIGGRSGEGRQGKSSGEFVGDEAIGKGGRKTPSRLTPDPYVKGQIKDHSKESAGGATGGGKESGKGGEGLEGPARRSPGKRDGERLANKQAALRNKAEGIDLQFQVTRFHHTDLRKMIDAMSQIERDLKAGRYQSALRQRQTLASGLGNVKQYLEGEFEVRQDKTANLPTNIQKEILGSMQDPSPPGWEELNRRYFERLSGSGSGAEEGQSGVTREKGKGEKGK